VGLFGRRVECDALDRLQADVVAGSSRVLVLRGEAGAGKSALLAYLSGKVADWRVLTAVGVESETELAYSGLRRWCAPLLDGLATLPGPQRDAFETVFGPSSGRVPDRFLVSLATLTLMAEAAEDGPLACIVDDAQWLDRASAQILTFVARRLRAEQVALVCATRTGSGDDDLAGMPALAVRGLGDGDARRLLLSTVQGPLDPAVTDQIVAESHGNPLALLELSRMHGQADLAGGSGRPGRRPVAKVERGYLRRLRRLPPDTQLLLLAAAAEPLGDAALLRAAAAALGLDAAAVTRAVDAGLLQVRGRVEFAHPLVRSATYHAAAPADRQRVHGALAHVTDPETDPDRRAWHRARATPGPDEDVAAELERAAQRAQARSGVAAAAAFGQRAVALTADPTRRADRALAAARASMQAGAFDQALVLVASAEDGALEEAQGAAAELLRGQVTFASGLGGDAPALLLRAARRLEPVDPALARETYLTAWGAAAFAGTDAVLEVSRAVRALPPSAGTSGPLDLLLHGLALLGTSGPAAAARTLRRAAAALADLPAPDVLRWGWMATSAGAAVWDFDGMVATTGRTVQVVRDAGVLAQLPIPLAVLGATTAWSGDFAGAAALVAEARSVAAATGSAMPPYAALRLQALQGREAEAGLVADTVEGACAAGPGLAAASAHWAAAVRYNGLGRHHDALPAARLATAAPVALYDPVWALPELVEAAARAGETEVARDALERLADTTRPYRTDFALGIEARSRALLSDGAVADGLYREAVERLGRTRLRPELARAHLLHGEWLRRDGRPEQARTHLRTAHDLLAGIGMAAFADRARRELLAAGEKVRRRSPGTRHQLTSQEEQIARLARDGLSNPEIGTQLFLSARTVEWHLRKVFSKLGISSRRELRQALLARERPVAWA
jgi:DNA-binding CsgD family transcriptional regulator